MQITKKYGWSSTNAPCSCNFVSPLVLRLLKKLEVVSVLDVGCGNGALCGMLKHEGFDVVGAEYDRGG